MLFDNIEYFVVSQITKIIRDKGGRLLCLQVYVADVVHA
jgi:hypothetical protein